jgi:hypothetical protein
MPTTAKKGRATPKRAPKQNKPERPKTTRGMGWGKGADLQEQELTLPSGTTCLVKRPQTPELIASGLVDRLDVLTPVVNKWLVQPAKNPDDLPNGESTQRKVTLEDEIVLTELADRVASVTVVDPVLLLAPTPRCTVCGWEGNNLQDHKSEDGHAVQIVPRDPDAYYTDGVDPRDKLAILAWVMGGPRAMESFLEASERRVGAVASEPSMEGATE